MNAALDRLLDALVHTELPPIALGLERVVALMAELGNPQLRIPPVVHVAGTNGKASTLAYIRSMLEAAGLGVHLYSSPELVRFNERIVLGGTMVDDELLMDALTRARDAATRVPATFFEVTTAAAFLLFSEHSADITLLETGLGGRLDATNIIDQPLLTLITSISMDHQEYLGDTLQKIAAEKAGIIKPGVPCVVAPQHPDAMQVIRDIAVSQQATLHAAGQEWTYKHDGTSLIVSDAHTTAHAAWSLPLPTMAGAHQCDNAATAVAAAWHLQRAGIPLTQAHAQHAMLNAQVPGRMQPLTQGALADRLPKGWQLWVDGGHNAAAGQALADIIRQWDMPVTLIFGMMRDKDAQAFLRPMAPHIDKLITITMDAHGRGAQASDLQSDARAIGLEATPVSTLEDAMQEALAGTHATAIVIAGSLTLAGLALSANGSVPE